MRYLISLGIAVVVAGCAHQTNAPKVEQARPELSTKPAQASAAAPAESLCSRDLDCGDGRLCLHQHCVNISSGAAECESVRVHFDFNSSQIHEADRPVLQRMAVCLKAEQAVHVTVEGNADERGTEEYNLALGDKRATAVEKYLEALGVSGQQLRTVSYGKERPLCTEHDEACWAKNRRAGLNASEAAKAAQR